MTRRTIIFTDPATGTIYATPEFNGDKAEFELAERTMGKGLDWCDKDWSEILNERFSGVETLKDFTVASDTAQMDYHSFLGVSVLPIKKVDNFSTVTSDYIIFISSDIGTPTKFVEIPLKINQDITISEITPITNPKADLYGYIVFQTEVDGYGLESLFRVYDPANGNPMEIVSIDYGLHHKDKIDPAWNDIEKALKDIAENHPLCREIASKAGGV